MQKWESDQYWSGFSFCLFCLSICFLLIAILLFGIFFLPSTLWRKNRSWGCFSSSQWKFFVSIVCSLDRSKTSVESTNQTSITNFLVIMNVCHHLLLRMGKVTIFCRLMLNVQSDEQFLSWLGLLILTDFIEAYLIRYWLCKYFHLIFIRTSQLRHYNCTAHNAVEFASYVYLIQPYGWVVSGILMSTKYTSFFWNILKI